MVQLFFLEVSLEPLPAPLGAVRLPRQPDLPPAEEPDHRGGREELREGRGLRVGRPVVAPAPTAAGEHEGAALLLRHAEVLERLQLREDVLLPLDPLVQEDRGRLHPFPREDDPGGPPGRLGPVQPLLVSHHQRRQLLHRLSLARLAGKVPLGAAEHRPALGRRRHLAQQPKELRPVPGVV